MDVEYRLTKDDLFAFQWRAATRRRLPLAKSDLALLAAALVAMGLLVHRGESSRLGWLTVLSDLTGPLVFVTCIAVLLSFFMRQNARRAIRMAIDDERVDGGRLGAHKIVLTETQFIDVTAVAESRTSWAGVYRVEEDDEYIFVYTGPREAHLVPKRAFADGELANRFYESIKHHVEAGRC